MNRRWWALSSSCSVLSAGFPVCIEHQLSTSWTPDSLQSKCAFRWGFLTLSPADFRARSPSLWDCPVPCRVCCGTLDLTPVASPVVTTWSRHQGQKSWRTIYKWTGLSRWGGPSKLVVLIPACLLESRGESWKIYQFSGPQFKNWFNCSEVRPRYFFSVFSQWV